MRVYSPLRCTCRMKRKLAMAICVILLSLGIVRIAPGGLHYVCAACIGCVM